MESPAPVVAPGGAEDPILGFKAESDHSVTRARMKFFEPLETVPAVRKLR